MKRKISKHHKGEKTREKEDKPRRGLRFEFQDLLKSLGTKKIIMILIIYALLIAYPIGIVASATINRMPNNYTFGMYGNWNYDFNFFTCIIRTFSSLSSISMWFCTMSIVGILILCCVTYRLRFKPGDMDERFEMAKDKTKGSARFLSKEEMYQCLEIGKAENTKGAIIGAFTKDTKSKQPDLNRVISLPEAEKTFLNWHTAVIGVSGSYKSSAYCIPNIMQVSKRGESIVIADPKGELYQKTAPYLKEQGYKILLYNLDNPEQSDNWNFMKEIGYSEKDIALAADVIIRNTIEDGKPDHFWDPSQAVLLKALFLYVNDEYTRLVEKYGVEEVSKLDSNPGTLQRVFDILKKENDPKTQFDYLKEIFCPAHCPCEAARYAFQDFLYYTGSPQVIAGVLGGLASRLGVLNNKIMRDMLSNDGIEMDEIGQQKVACYVIKDVTDRSTQFLMALFFSILFIKLSRITKLNDRIVNNEIKSCLPVPVNLMLDEFPNIGEIPDFDRIISLVRSWGVHITIILQGIPQLVEMYETNWQTILMNCDLQILLASNDEVTTEYFSNRSGTATVMTKQIRTTRDSFSFIDFPEAYMEGSSETERVLLTPNEIETLENDEAIIILRSKNILKVRKYFYKWYPGYKEVIPWSQNRHKENIIKGEKEDVKELESFESEQYYERNETLMHNDLNVLHESLGFVSTAEKDSNEKEVFNDQEVLHKGLGFITSVEENEMIEEEKPKNNNNRINSRSNAQEKKATPQKTKRQKKRNNVIEGQQSISQILDEHVKKQGLVYSNSDDIEEDDDFEDYNLDI